MAKKMFDGNTFSFSFTIYISVANGHWKEKFSEKFYTWDINSKKMIFNVLL